MERPTQLHHIDEKTLTAKSMAFSVLVKHEHRWVAEESDALIILEQSIHAAKSLGSASPESLDLVPFLKQHVDYIHSTVAPVMQNSPVLLDNFVQALHGTRKDWLSIGKQAERWLGNLRTVAEAYLDRYATRKVEIPPIHMYQQVSSSDCSLRGLGGVTLEENGERIIWLSYDPDKFGKHSYFSIPYVLSHEFWCHALSRLPIKNQKGQGSVFGTDPSNGFEEGWMDYVQLQILQQELSAIVESPGEEAYFDDHSLSCHHERNNQPGNQFVHLGVMVGKRFHAFLNQQEKALGVADSDSTFLQTSLDLNLLPGFEDAKSDLVVELGGRLEISTQGEKTRLAVARKRDNSLEAKHTALLRDLKGALMAGKLPPAPFLNILKLGRL